MENETLKFVYLHNFPFILIAIPSSSVARTQLMPICNRTRCETKGNTTKPQNDAQLETATTVKIANCKAASAPLRALQLM